MKPLMYPSGWKLHRLVKYQCCRCHGYEYGDFNDPDVDDSIHVVNDNGYEHIVCEECMTPEEVEKYI